MPQYTELTEDLGSRLSDLIGRVQTFQTDAISAVRDRVESFLPELPTPALLENLPKPEQMARANFALAEQLLRAQKRYALGILDALQPSEKAAEPDETVQAEVAAVDAVDAQPEPSSDHSAV